MPLWLIMVFHSLIKTMAASRSSSDTQREYDNLVMAFEAKLAIDAAETGAPVNTNNNYNSKAEVTTPPVDATKKKERKTLFWGVHVDPQLVLGQALVKDSLEKNPQLIPLKKMHSTLLYVGRKDNDQEAVYMDLIDRECRLTVTSFGCSPNALALKVDSIVFVDNGDAVKSFNTIQHVTVALAEGTKAVDSIKSFDEGTVEKLDKPLILEGKLTRYFF